MTKIDICIVAGRRPDLLAETLSSMSSHVFRHFEVAGAYMNIDPIFGDQSSHEQCLEIFKSHFPQGTVFEPEAPGFAAAVGRVWAATTAEFVFHMEDDWIALQDIGVEVLAPFEDPSVAQVSLHTAEKYWDVKKSGHLHRKRQYFRFAGVKLPKFTSKPIFTTSPSILRGDFAHSCSALFDPAKDPEKQFYLGVNAALESHVGALNNFIFSPENKPVIKDIGRDWRSGRGITKIVTNGSSTWEGM